MDQTTGNLLGDAMAGEAVRDDDGPIDPSLAARFPSMRNGRVVDGTPRRVPRNPPAPGYVHPDRLAAHQEALRQVQDRETQLRNMYPTMYQPGPAPMRPVGPDPALERRYPSMPGGGVDLPAPAQGRSPDPTQPAPAPAQQATPPAAASSEQPSVPAPADLPPQYAGLAVPEGLGVDAGALSSAAQRMAEVGFSRQQAEAALQLHAEQVQAEDAHIASMRAGWRSEAEKIAATPEARQAMATAMRGAPAEVREVLDASGLGNHPALVRWVIDVGRRLGGIAPTEDPHLRRYPSMRNR